MREVAKEFKLDFYYHFHLDLQHKAFRSNRNTFKCKQTCEKRAEGALVTISTYRTGKNRDEFLVLGFSYDFVLCFEKTTYI